MDIVPGRKLKATDPEDIGNLGLVTRRREPRLGTLAAQGTYSSTAATHLPRTKLGGH